MFYSGLYNAWEKSAEKRSLYTSTDFRVIFFSYALAYDQDCVNYL